MDAGWVYGFIGLLLLERLLEVGIARRNRAWIIARGGTEHHRSFTQLLLTFHGLWFIAFGTEAFLRDSAELIPPVLTLVPLLVLQAGRYACIISLGPFWNTRIYVLPGAAPVRRGLYRRFRHPNYLIVLIEIPLYPALFGCFYTAFLFGAVNLWVLKNRIRQEDQAMADPRSRGSRPAAYC